MTTETSTENTTTDGIELDLVQRRPEFAQRFPLPEGWMMAWGARTIYKLLRTQDRTSRGKLLPSFTRTASIDVLHDRHEMVGGTTAERRTFGAWIDQHGMPAIKRLCEEQEIEARDETTIEFASDGYAIKASPNASFGYLYILAWKVP
jgi:hypothetical protein